MEIRGKLREDIINGNAVLFLGAGIGMDAGLHGARGLANYLFQETGNHERFAKYKDDLAKLVAQIDKDPQFTRKWIDEKLTKYFLEDSNYQELENHTKLLENGWKAIFTTNYDIAVEKAGDNIQKKSWRLLPISNPKNRSLIYGNESGKLKYFKIHGCADDLDKNPSNCAPLVITHKDFIESVKRNRPFWDELERYALNHSVVFIGFNAHQRENNHILANIFEAQKEITRNFEQPYSPFAVLPIVDEDTKEEIDNIGINLIEGSFEEFVDTITILRRQGSGPTKLDSEEMTVIKAVNKEVKITRSEITEYSKQFRFYHSKFFEEQKREFDSFIPEKKIDAWKSAPTLPFIYSGNCITRSQFKEAYEGFLQTLHEVANAKSSRLYIVGGKRASGKTVFVHQLAYEVFKEFNNPVLFLNRNASYVEESADDKKENIISGWNGRQFDKFLSFFHSDTAKPEQLVPVIIADHVSYRQNTLDQLIKYLTNHAKPCLLVLTLNEDEWNEEIDQTNLGKSIKLSSQYPNKKFFINHKLDNTEIDSLFSVISRDFHGISVKEHLLKSRALDENEANRDILLILYQWFDKDFRRLNEIIIEESEKLNANEALKNLYLSVSAFYQYNIKPPIQACVNASGISLQEFEGLKSSPLFKALIEVFLETSDSDDEYAFSRHPEYSRRIFEHLCSDRKTQHEIIKNVFRESIGRDLLFVRAFFNYLYEIDSSHTVQEVQEFKEATEEDAGLKRDPVLNHQFGAYLIRENSDLNDARYYIDLAIEEDENNPAFIHSIGNLHYRLFKNSLEEGDEDSATEHFENAKVYFEKNRALRRYPDEYGYVTDIVMTRYKRDNSLEINQEAKAVLTAESESLFFEALSVVPKENQNYLVTRLQAGKKFGELSQDEREILLDRINNGNASGSLLQYYTQDLLGNSKPKNWLRLKKVVSTYFPSDDPKILIPISIVSKKAFILTAAERFERLRVLFDKLVRYKDEEISFVLLAEYIKLLIVDAFVLGKYQFISKAMGEILNKLFIRSFPRFIADEYILETKFYQFDQLDEDHLKKLFTDHSQDFGTGRNAMLFHKLINIGALENNPFVKIEIDRSTRFWVKAIRKEIATSSSKAELSFKVKYAWDGLKATDFKG